MNDLKEIKHSKKSEEIASYGALEKKTDERKYTKTQKIFLLTLAIGEFCSGCVASLQAPFFPEEAERKGATAAEYGLIFGMYHITIVLTAPMIGKLVGHVSPKFILNSGFLILGVTSMLFGALDLVKKSNEFIALAFIVRICEGVGASCARIACGTIVASQFQENVGATYALLEMSIGVAVILGPVIGAALYELGGFKLPFFCIGTITLIDAVLIMFVLPEAEKKEKKPTKFRKIFKVWMKPKILVFSFSVFSTFGFLGYNSVGLEPHLRQIDLSKLYIGLLFSVLGLIYAISSPFWGWLHDRMCKSTVINLAGSFFFITSILLVGPVPFIPLETDLYLIILSMTSLGVAAGSKTVSCFTGGLDSAKQYGFPDDLGTYGMITSIITSSKSLGSAFGPSIGGMILEKWGFRYGTLLYLVIELIMVVFLCTIILTEEGSSKVFRTTDKSFENSISLDSKNVAKNDQKI